jgi:hypothetical protein
MCSGYALYIHRFVHMIVGRTSVLVAATFFAVVLATQAQESVEEVALPPWSEPTLPSSEPAPSTQAATVPSAQESLPSAPESIPSAPEPVPSAPEPLASTSAQPSESVPSSEQAFPSLHGQLSISTPNYTTGYQEVVPAPVATGPYGGSYNVFPAGETVYSAESRNFHYVLRLTVRGVWDDNIFLSHTDKVSGYYFAIEPSISIGWGDMEGRSRSYLRLDYLPSAILFVDHSNQDAFNQYLHLEAGYSTGRLTLRLAEDIAILQSANLNSFYDTTGLWANTDASTPTRVNIFYTSFIANYALTPKISLQGEFNSPSYAYPGNISNYTVSGGLYVYYNVRPKLSVGIGGTFGYTWVDEPSTNQSFEQINLRLEYEWTAKLALYASAGVEFRQFDGNRNTYDSPVFNVGVAYHPFSGTNISLAAGRIIYPSGYIDNQDFGATYVAVRIQQRLFHRFYLGLGGGYEWSDYISTDRDVSATRNDNYWFIEPSLDVLITRWLSAGVYYLHRQDSSNVNFNDWNDNQVGVRATVRF